MKFKVGDKVRVVKVNHEIKNSYIGKEMVIKSINPNDKYGMKKHSENHYGFEKCLLVFHDSELALVDNHKIVITTENGCLDTDFKLLSYALEIIENKDIELQAMRNAANS